MPIQVPRQYPPPEAASPKGFCCQVENDTVVLRKQHDYYFQVQCQMTIWSRKWHDFLIFTITGISVTKDQF